jgi:hypothetical protein
LLRWRRLLGKNSPGCCQHGTGGASTEKHASSHMVVRYVCADTHRLPPFVVVESVAVTPNVKAHRERP